jgi:hypothetical protein
MFHAAINFCSMKGCCSSGRWFSTFRRFMQLTPLQQRRFASPFLHRHAQRLGAIQHLQLRFLKIHTSLFQFRA